VIRRGQVYASTHSGDVENGQRQRRRVVNVQLGTDSFVWLQTEEGNLVNVAPTRIRLRSPMARTIPGHRLVEDVDA
jgi:hypothetical protein